jgi:two-component system, sensor histidine kinase and response regulator
LAGSDDFADLLVVRPAQHETPGIQGQRAQRLLVVDDDPAILTLMQTHLVPLGFELVTALTEQAAIAAFDAQEPDLVVLDLIMPGIGGLGVLAHIRAHTHGGHVPVILITAHSERSHRLLGLRAGADEFLEKPIDMPVVVARLTTLLQLKQSRDDLQLSRNTLAARNDLLENLQREQHELTQFVVHDLKNQLSVVLMSLECAAELAQKHRHADMRDLLSEGEIGARRLRTMVEDLLAVSKLEELLPVQRQQLSVSELIAPVVAAYQHRARHQAVTITQPNDAEWPLCCDAGLLRRVFENILDNALRYAPSGGHIAVSARRGEQIEIAISNDGPPIPVEQRRRIFDKFRRGVDEPPSLGNAGLGLYFCKRAVEAHGGQISVRESADAEWPTSFVMQFAGSA